MKALTIKQPWAWAILLAGKDVENRSWSTDYRGPLLIHAGASFDRLAQLPQRTPPVPDDLVFSAILGVVDLVDVVEASRSKWFSGPYGWVLRNPRPFRSPVAGPGRLRLWEPSPAQIRAVRRQLG